MLGWTPAQIEAEERHRFLVWLKSMPWIDRAGRSHDGYCRDQFRGLLDGQEPPSRFAWRKLVWMMNRCHRALQEARRQLNAAVSAA